MMKQESVPTRPPQTAERGVALIIALLAMTVIAGLGFALLVSSSTESLVNASFRRASLAHFDAMAGLEELRGRMGPDARPIAADLTSVRIPCSTPATCPPLYNFATRTADLTRGYYVRLSGVDPTNTGCTYQGVNCYDNDPNRPTSPILFTTAQPGTAMPYVWVRVQVATQQRLKRNLTTPCNPTDPTSPSYCNPTSLDNARMVCWTGTEPRIAEAFPLPDPSVCGDPVNPLLIFTAMSIQPGGTVRVIRELAALGKTPSLPGGLVLDGCPSVFPPPSSTPFEISGIDVGSVGDSAHSITTRCSADRDVIQTAIYDQNNCPGKTSTPYPGCQEGPNRNPDYPGVGNNDCVNPNCNNTPESADIFYDPNLSNPVVNPFLANCGGLQSLVQYLRQAAYQYGYVYPGGATNIPNPGDGNPTNNPAAWNRVINVITGDATLGQADFGNPGAGIILIEGNLTLNGYPTYNGLILIIGTGQVTISGGGSGVVNGGILLANTSTCTGPTDNPGPVSFNQSGGGNFQLEYNSDAIEPLNGTLPVQKLSLNY